MRKLGDQWIENGRMYKAVAGSNCNGCAFGKMCKSQRSMTDIHICDREDECPIDCSDMIIKDLGHVNEAGCLAEERTGVYPEIANKFDLFAMDRVWVAEFQYSDSKGRYIQMQLRANSKQEVINLWNQREAL